MTRVKSIRSKQVRARDSGKRAVSRVFDIRGEYIYICTQWFDEWSGLVSFWNARNWEEAVILYITIAKNIQKIMKN